MNRDSQEEHAAAIRDEVRRTLQHLNKLAQTERNFDLFCDEALSNLVKITGAYGALLWQAQGGMPRLTHQSGNAPNATAQAIVARDNQQHNSVLKEVLTQQQPIGLTSESFQKSNGSASASNVEDPFLLLFSPIFNRASQCWGTLELVQRGDITNQAQEGYLRFLTQIAQLFQRWHEQQDLARLSENADQWHGKLEFVTEVHRYLNLRETAYAIANESRRLLGCDRVSVARWNGSRCKIEAISGQDRFDDRANVVKRLQTVATSSVSADSPFWINGSTDGLAPEVARQINDYLDEAHSRTLIVLPLSVRGSDAPDLEMKRRKEKPRKLGAIIIEYFDADVTEDLITEKKELIVSQAELAIENSRRHGEVFLLPVFERLGKLQHFLLKDHFAKSMTGLASLGILTLFMIFFPWELKMRVEGVMKPTERQTIFSQVDGSLITEVLVDEQSPVTKGDVLLKLENKDLDIQIADIEGRINMTKSEEENALAMSGRENDLPQRPGQNRGLSDLNLIRSNLANLRKQLELQKIKREQLEIKSPITGVVITSQPKPRLTNYPAGANMAVLEVVNPKGPWELDLTIPQHKVGYVSAAQAKSSEPLEVEFRLGTDPTIVFKGKLIRVSPRAVASQAGSTEYKALVNADAEQFAKLKEELRTGAGVTAKIFCGKRSLGFVCFHQIIDWLRTKVFF